MDGDDMNRRYIVDGEPVFVDGSLGQELSILKGFMKAESGLQAVYDAMDKIKAQRETIDKLQDELTEAYYQLGEKHGGIKEERDKLKLAIHRIHKHLEGIAEYECSDDMWSIFLAIDEEVEDVLNESSPT